MRTSTDTDSHAQTTRSGRLFIVSAPSGAGKTTLCGVVRRHFKDLAYSISSTTRDPRPGERDGIDYFFVSREVFEDGIAQGRWAEWAEVHGNLYGTSAQWISQALSEGRDILLDIDVQGARQLLTHFPDAVSIFICPPSMGELERRLRQRGGDDDATIAVRLRNAQNEMDQKAMYRHVLVNDDLDQAKSELLAIIDSYRSLA